MRSALILSILLIFPPALLFSDTIEMMPAKDDGEGLKMEGTVHLETEEFVILLVHNEAGQVRIPRKKIKSIEYDVKTQLKKLDDDDVAGRYKVGLWAIEKGMIPEAIEILESVKDSEGVNPEVNKHLGHAYEQRQQWDKALESYSRFVLSKDDPEIKEKIAVLKQKVTPQSAAAAASAKKIVEGLEADGQWLAEKWGNPAAVAISTDPLGNKLVGVQIAIGGTKDKTAISRTGQPLDLRDSREMIFRLFHTAPNPLTLSIAFVNSQGEFHETKQLARVLPNTWNNLSVRVDDKTFKAMRNEFKTYDLELQGRERINQILFLVYGSREMTMHIDSLFFKETPKDPAK